MSQYTTGELVKRCNVSVRTVQFCDTKGILHPSGLTEGGRRLYNDDDLRKFQIVCTLKAMGLSLNAVKNVLESEVSGNILTLLLNEQVKLLTGEIDERRKQLEMIAAIQESIRDKTIIPENIILGIDSIMENKNMIRSKKKLAVIYVGVGSASAAGLLFMGGLAVSQMWWELASYISAAIISLLIALFQLKKNVFICPKCDSVFKPPLMRAFFSTGGHKVRWMTCPECGHTDWCVLRNPTQTGEV
jgi:DNA-binding transcriptional MerR regulator